MTTILPQFKQEKPKTVPISSLCPH